MVLWLLVFGSSRYDTIRHCREVIIKAFVFSRLELGWLLLHVLCSRSALPWWCWHHLLCPLSRFILQNTSANLRSFSFFSLFSLSLFGSDTWWLWGLYWSHKLHFLSSKYLFQYFNLFLFCISLVPIHLSGKKTSIQLAAYKNDQQQTRENIGV